MLDSHLTNTPVGPVGSATPRSAILAFRLRHKLTQPYIAERLGLSQPWVVAREKLHVKEERWVLYALLGLEAEQAQLKRSKSDDCPSCPECGAKMKPRNWYLRHWYYGKLKACFYCKGTAINRHARFGLGLLSDGQFQRLDRIVNKSTGQETQLKSRKQITTYEKEYGWVWCDPGSQRHDGCGGLCTPIGKYRFHGGREYQVFRCFNPQCVHGGGGKGGARLYAWKGQLYVPGSIPSTRQRVTSLSSEATKCYYCRGFVHSRGRAQAPPNCIQLHCTRCGKISYWDEVNELSLPGRESGGTFRDDPHRPRCTKCAKHDRHVTRRGFTKAMLQAQPTRVPLPVRRRMTGWKWLRELIQDAQPGDEIVCRYVCPHREVYKASNGNPIWTRPRTEKLRRGRTIKNSREGRPLKGN